MRSASRASGRVHAVAQGSIAAGSHLEIKKQPGHRRLPNESPVEEQAKFQQRPWNTVSAEHRNVSFLGPNTVGKVGHILPGLLEILFLLATGPNILIKQRCCC